MALLKTLRLDSLAPLFVVHGFSNELRPDPGLIVGMKEKRGEKLGADKEHEQIHRTASTSGLYLPLSILKTS